ETTEAKVRGYLPGRFSFNVKGGRCEACSGDGTIKIEMNFLPDVYVPCEICHGARYNRETLEVHFKGKTISEVLDMPIEEAAEFFEAVPAIRRHLQTLVDVGLGYVRLGQPAPTLSGGEAQRVKLAAELQKRQTGRTVYVLDEPTTGLHFEDIRKLLGVLGRLVDQGNSVIVIEHNLDVIKTADWVIDMGPEGGSGGGTVVAEGTPEQVAQVEASHTGRFLKEILAGRGRFTSPAGEPAPPKLPAAKKKAAPRKKVAAAR
ncbi:MAG: excinuclease subunit, partial [Frankiales bacterium]|nr:excinuclease subunit [Frankiales bacterium]